MGAPDKRLISNLFFIIKTKFRTGIWCSKMIQDLKDVFMESWMKTNFHFWKTFADFPVDGSEKYFFVLFWFLFFLILNIVFNMNLFIWNRSDHWHAHNQRLKMSMFFKSFYEKSTLSSINQTFSRSSVKSRQTFL